MANQAKIDEKALARIEELARQGRAHSQIAATLRAEGLANVAERTVGRHIRQLRAAGAQIRKSGRGRPEKRPGPAGASGNGPPPLVEDTSPATLRDASRRTAAEVLQRVQMATALAKQAHADGDWNAFDRMAKLEATLAGQLCGMIPPEPPDPDKDPANTEARDAVIALIERMVKETG